MGIRLKIAIKGAVPPEFELMSSAKENLLDSNTANVDTGENSEHYVSDDKIEKLEVKEEVKS
jgi:hypothetical protein